MANLVCSQNITSCRLSVSEFRRISWTAQHGEWCWWTKHYSIAHGIRNVKLIEGLVAMILESENSNKTSIIMNSKLQTKCSGKCS